MKKITPFLLIVAIQFYFPAHAQSWLIDGNTGTNPKIHFIGNKDNAPLFFRIRNIFSGMIDSTYRQTYFGYGSGANMGGTDNTAFGYKALPVNTSGTYNTAVGSMALNANTTGIYNTAAGYSSLTKNTTGQQNSGFGMYALGYNTTGFGNSGFGAYAVNGNTSGSYNTGNGYEALYWNSTGYYNTATGATSMIGNFTGSSNTADGYEALSNNNAGNWNTATGRDALRFNYNGSYNSGLGGNALYYVQNSQYNTGIGYNAGNGYDLGWNNTFLGANTRTNGAGYYNVIAIGQDVVCTAVSQARIGNSATSSIGGYVGWTNISDGRYKKAVKEDVKGLDFILQLRPVSYQLDVSGLSKFLGEDSRKEGDLSSRKAIADKEKITYTGFIAQEVEVVAQKLGFDFSGVDKPKNDKDLYGLRYAEFVVPLVKAVQEQQEEITLLKKEIELLKEQQKALAPVVKNK
jgi:hypothetical protein